MNIAITGATGFIGSHLIKTLGVDHNLFFIVRPTTQIDDLEAKGTICVDDGDNSELVRFFKEHKIDGVVHLASLFLAGHAITDVAELIRSNVEFSTRLLESATKAELKWFLNTGSFWQHYEDKTYNPVNLYAATKEAFLTIAKYYLETTQINFVTLKLADSYGEGDPRKKLITLLYDCAMSGSPIKMTPGEQRLSLNHIDDIVTAFTHLILLLEADTEKKYRGQDFNITSNERPKISELVALIEEITNKKINADFNGRPYRNREVMIPWTAKKTVPGWEQKVSLKEGLTRMFSAKRKEHL